MYFYYYYYFLFVKNPDAKTRFFDPFRSFSRQTDQKIELAMRFCIFSSPETFEIPPISSFLIVFSTFTRYLATVSQNGRVHGIELVEGIFLVCLTCKTELTSP